MIRLRLIRRSAISLKNNVTKKIARQVAPQGVSVNACHPGDVCSRLASNLGFGGHETPDQGARTPAWLATEETGGTVTGKYFEHRRETPCCFAADRAAVEALYAACAEYG